MEGQEQSEWNLRERGSLKKEEISQDLFFFSLLLWEGSAEVQWDYRRGYCCCCCSSLHLHRLWPLTTSLLLCPSIHPFSALFFQILARVLTSFLPFFFGTYPLVSVSFPSLVFQSPSLFSLRERDRKSEVIPGRKPEIKGERVSAAALRSHCCCWLDVIQRDLIGKKSILISGKLHCSIFIYLSVPLGNE